MQTRRYISRFEPLLYVPAFTQKDFHYIHTEPSTKGPPLRNYNSTPGVHNSSLNTQTSTQEAGTKPSTKQKKIQLVITKITNSLLVILKDNKQIFSQKQDPIDGYRIDSSSVRNQSVWKINHKEKYLEKNTRRR